MPRPSRPRPDRTAPAARAARWAVAAACGLAAAGCSERISGSERLVLAEGPRAGTGASAPRGAGPREPTAHVLRRFRTEHDGRTLPLFSPDGSRCAVQASTDADWAVRIGDPLPPDGLSGRIEVFDCREASMGRPLARLDGAWLLGRGASDEGVCVERPRADGGRDLGVLGWDGRLRMFAEDGAANAFGTLGPDGLASWCRRAPEGGDWQLVVQRGERRRVLPAAPGSSLLMPTFAGDGSGVFALRLDGTALGACWMPFEADGLPAADAGVRPASFRPLGVRANLSVAVRAMDPQSGGGASPAGRGDLVVWSPEAARCTWWIPGNDMQALGPRSMAALAIEDGDALSTTPEGLRHDRLGVDGVTSTLLVPEAWIPRATTEDARMLMAFRFLGREAEIAAIRLEPPDRK